MKIVIDGRLYHQSGVGRYLQKLIENLAQIDQKNQYVIFLIKADFNIFELPAKNFRKRLVDIPWHSLAEQLLLPVYLISEKPDLVHFPITIHDLIIDHFDTGRASTRNLIIYELKRLCYKIIIKSAILRANKIIAVSQSTKKEIISHYGIVPSKVQVTYEAADLKKTNDKRLITNDYLLYVGNAYPHKNLERLLEVISNLKLVLVGKEDFFYQRLEKKLTSNQKTQIIFFGYANDQQLANLYTYARAFVFPSLMEGFGLPGLEAMKIGTPVTCSDIPVFHEIYQEAALYFNPQNSSQMAQQISRLLQDKSLQDDLRKKGFGLVEKFSWSKMAKETKTIYESCFNLRSGK